MPELDVLITDEAPFRPEELLQADMFKGARLRSVLTGRQAAAWEARAGTVELIEAQSRSIEIRLTRDLDLVDTLAPPNEPTVPPGVQAQFNDLFLKWKEATAFTSSASTIVNDPNYIRIIAMGPTVIPCLLQELERKPAHLFAALKRISGEDPVPPAERGRPAEMAQAWLRWGRERGYLR